MGNKHRLFLAAFCAGAAFASGASMAQAEDKAFFASVAGLWTGPGKIVAGKYAGTKFNCRLTGDPIETTDAGIVMDGSCRVGVFSQKMTATIRQTEGGYTGEFLDGADGEGLDIVAGRVDGDRVLMGITREELDGAMVARLTDAHTMNVTVSVKVGETVVPVIGVTLARDTDSIAVGAVR